MWSQVTSKQCLIDIIASPGGIGVCKKYHRDTPSDPCRRRKHEINEKPM
jgi:hypothetical protein